MHHVLAPPKQRRTKHLRGPISLAVARPTGRRNDDVVHPRRIRAGIDASVLGVFPCESLGRCRNCELLQAIVHRARPSLGVTAVSAASGVVNTEDEIIKTTFRGNAVPKCAR